MKDVKDTSYKLKGKILCGTMQVNMVDALQFLVPISDLAGGVFGGRPRNRKSYGATSCEAI